jgi:hypothetical protein
VLAHEFGHFAQRAGTRSGYVIQMISLWFVRAVYQRDEWDAWLARACEEGDWRFQGFFVLGKAGIAVARIPLRLLMYAGVGLTCFLRRQQEYDADRYEAIIGGTRAFIESMESLPVLSVATQAAYHHLRESWKERKLVDDLPAQIVHEAHALSDEVKKSLRDAAAKATSGVFHTHPSPAERIRAVQLLNEPGIFTLEEPASVLFQDFPALCREVTRRHYEEVVGLKLGAGNLKNLEESLEHERSGDDANKTLEALAPGAATIWEPLDFDPAYVGAPADASVTQAALDSARSKIRDERDDITAMIAEQATVEKRLTRMVYADSLSSAGISFNPADYELSSCDSAIVRAHLVRLRAEGQQRVLDRAPRQRLYLARFISAIQLLHYPEVAAQTKEAGTKQGEALRLVETLSKLKRTAAPLRELAHGMVALRALFDHGNRTKDASKFDRSATVLFRKLERNVGAVRTQLLGANYPFDHASGKISLNDFCRPGTTGSDAQHQAFLAASAYLDRLPDVYARSVARLAVIAAEVEDCLWPSQPRQPAF